MSFLENLRAKPIEYRQKFALFTSLSITLLIFAGWGIATIASFTSGDIKNQMTASASTSLSTFSVIHDQVSNMYDATFGKKDIASTSTSTLVQYPN